MKLLISSRSGEDLSEKSELLESKGVLVYLSSDNSRSLNGLATGATTQEIWVIIDEQYEEAKNILVDPSYVVKNPLSKKQMKDLGVSSFVELKRVVITVGIFVFVFISILMLVLYSFSR